ncbi:MAG: peptidase domain-containing ABC transporter [Bacteroidota bacterium]
MSFKFYRQLDTSDCGPTCLRMVAKHYGKSYSVQFLREVSYISREGVSLLTISEAAERIGFKTLKVGLSYKQLVDNAPLPAILHWCGKHFVVLYGIKRYKNKVKLQIADPTAGLVKIDARTFKKGWIPDGKTKGYALFLEPTEEFYTNASDARANPKTGFRFLLKYFAKYKIYFIQLALGMLGGSILSLIFPFLTQSIVDHGIARQDVSFIFLILIIQLFIFLGNTTLEFIRSFLLLHVSTRINISIVSDYLSKLTKLPIRFFDSKMIGDILTRVDGHKRIELFLTDSSINTLFSLVNLFVLTIVLGIYSKTVLLLFLIGSLLSIIWSLLFMRKRKSIDYKLFTYISEDRDNLQEIISGMQEIKLNNMELYKRWGWEKTQAKLFKTNISFLQLEQYQKIGANFFIQLKNIIITYVTAREVISGSITLGMMLSIAYIIGQMNSPINKIISFFTSAQNAMISLERMSEVHNQSPEDDHIVALHNTFSHYVNNSNGKSSHKENKALVDITDCRHSTSSLYESSLLFKDVSFQYEGPTSPYVLEDLHLQIPLGKVTAVVGVSGSGKTTMMKLLLKFYSPTRGQILIKGTNLENISSSWWRKQCGAVMQEGYTFADTIGRNIAGGSENIDINRLKQAAHLANIDDFISTLPLGFDTKIGNLGNSISTGQKQRILIARAIYRDPAFLFFDEATSALDANNEKVIVNNLEKVFRGKTVVIIAHRLSTVKHADQIVLLDHGKIVEVGDHNTLTLKRGLYYNLVKNQLELGA